MANCTYEIHEETDGWLDIYGTGACKEHTFLIATVPDARQRNPAISWHTNNLGIDGVEAVCRAVREYIARKGW